MLAVSLALKHTLEVLSELVLNTIVILMVTNLNVMIVMMVIIMLDLLLTQQLLLEVNVQHAVKRLLIASRVKLRRLLVLMMILLTLSCVLLRNQVSDRI